MLALFYAMFYEAPLDMTACYGAFLGTSAYCTECSKSYWALEYTAEESTGT
jgi:hypothetical protein